MQILVIDGSGTGSDMATRLPELSGIKWRLVLLGRMPGDACEAGAWLCLLPSDTGAVVRQAGALAAIPGRPPLLAVLESWQPAAAEAALAAGADDCLELAELSHQRLERAILCARARRIARAAAQTGPAAGAGEALRESEARLRRVLESDFVAILLWNVDGNVTFANRAFLSLVGYTRADVEAGRLRWSDLTPPEFASRDRAALAEMAEKGSCTPYEKEYIRRDGSRVPVLVGGALFEGRQDAGVGFVVDLSERCFLEQQLLQAQKMDALGRLAGGIAHDFNNLLTVINGYANVALSRLDAGHPVTPLIREIAAAGELAALFTGRLRSFGQRQIAQPSVFHPNQVVTGMLDMLRRLMGEEIEVEAALAGDLASIRSDPTQLEQVIMNLAVNSRDAMPGGGRLSIATANIEIDSHDAALQPGARPGPYVRLTVSDTGKGMNSEVRSHAIEPFFTTKEPGKGSGLGLSTVYAVVRQSGGFLTVSSHPGQGTTVEVCLPAAESSEEAPGVETPPAPTQGGETILLVEDESGVRRLIQQVLEQRGYQVYEAADGIEALELAARLGDRVDLLITDVVMPRMGGPELVERLRAAYPGLKVLFVSGYTGNRAIRSGQWGPGGAFLAKPFTLPGLIDKVRGLLDAPTGDLAGVT